MLELSPIGVATAFAAGIVSFLSPCVLPIVPGYLSYIAGPAAAARAEAGSRAATVGLSGCFVLGFATVFILLGAGATALGQLLLAWRYELNLAGGALVVLFGLVTMGLFRAPWLQRELRLHPDLHGGHPIAAYLLGLAFGFGWTPCIGPVLGAILTVSATMTGVREGAALLAIYALGLGVPFLLAAAFAGGFLARLRAMRRLGRPLQIAAGGVMALTGLAIMTGELSAFSYWLIDAFPWLASVG